MFVVVVQTYRFFCLDILYVFKGQLSGLRQFLTIEVPLKIMKNSFCFMLKDRS